VPDARPGEPEPVAAAPEPAPPVPPVPPMAPPVAPVAAGPALVPPAGARRETAPEPVTEPVAEPVAAAAAPPAAVAPPSPRPRASRYCPVCADRVAVAADGLHCHLGHKLSPAHGRRRRWFGRHS